MATRKALEGEPHMRLDNGTDASTATTRRVYMSTLKTAATVAAGVMLAAVADAVDLLRSLQPQQLSCRTDPI